MASDGPRTNLTGSPSLGSVWILKNSPQNFLGVFFCKNGGRNEEPWGAFWDSTLRDRCCLSNTLQFTVWSTNNHLSPEELPSKMKWTTHPAFPAQILVCDGPFRREWHQSLTLERILAWSLLAQAIQHISAPCSQSSEAFFHFTL